MFDWASLRPIWEPRVLSILRIIVGLLFLEFGLAKVFDFPAMSDHQPYHLFSLVPGLAGILESVGGALIAIGLFTRPVAFILSGEMAFAYFMVYAPRSFFQRSAVVFRRFYFASFSSISSSPVAASGASIGCGRAGRPAMSPPGAGSDRASNLTRGPPG